MVLKSSFKLILAISSLFFVNFLIAQNRESRSLVFTPGAELVSSYIWRGQDYSHTPSFQPWAEISWKGFTLGAWSAFRISGEGEDEIDFYLNKEIGPFLISPWRYWGYREGYNTSQMYEGQIYWSIGEKNTLQFMLSSLFEEPHNRGTIYAECEYLLNLKESHEFKFHIGAQLKGDYYSSGNGIVNCGASYKKMFTVLSRRGCYLTFSAIFNPMANKGYLTAAIGF